MERLPFEIERKLIVKGKATTNPEFGNRPEDRAMQDYLAYGVINLDKPAGPTSHEVVSWVKRVLGVKKAGHGGTLDPRVTGVLPVALEEGTKVVQTLLPAGKEYVCIMRLHEKVDEKTVADVCKEFTGKIIQRPPLKSAVKREHREREIYYLKILEIDNKDVLLKIGCQAGTYMRKLCHDIGEALGCGAHMLELRRTKSGAFDIKSSVTLHDVTDAYHFWKEQGTERFLREVITPIEGVVEYLPKIIIRDSAVDALCHGAALAVPGVCKLDSEINAGDMVAIFTLKDELVSIGEAKMKTMDMLVKDSGIVAVSKRVIMKPDTYRRMWKEEPT